MLDAGFLPAVFMDHFQRIAKGHFTLRRLERTYGSAVIRKHYDAMAANKLLKTAS